VLCQSECACLHKTVNMVVFFVKSNENTYTKGRVLTHMYRVVTNTKMKSWRTWAKSSILSWTPATVSPNRYKQCGLASTCIRL